MAALGHVNSEVVGPDPKQPHRIARLMGPKLATLARRIPGRNMPTKIQIMTRNAECCQKGRV